MPGPAGLEERVREEVSDLVGALGAAAAAGPFDPKEPLATAVMNSIWVMVAGRRFEWEDPDLRDMASGSKSRILRPGGSFPTKLFCSVRRGVLPSSVPIN